MSHSPIDYDAIHPFEPGARIWSMRLVDRLRNELEDDEEMEAILSLMEEFDDFRVEAPLTEIVLDSTLTDEIRNQASLALLKLTTSETPVQRAAWWLSGDLVLMRHAIRVFDPEIPEEATRVETLATDPTHDLHIDAIEALSWSFSEPRFQEIKIKALSHVNPLVRKAAAKALYWDQPVCAENALLIAASDPDDDVAVAAHNTLNWYSSKNVLLKFHELRCQGRPELLLCHNDSFRYLLDECLGKQDWFHSDSAREVMASEHYKAWLSPLWEILGLYEPTAEILTEVNNEEADDQQKEETESEDATNSPQSKSDMPMRSTIAEVIANYSNHDTPHKTYMDSEYDWNSFPDTERTELKDFFLASPDHLVRCISTAAFVKWNDTDTMVRLINDSNLTVRRTACWRATEMPPNQAIRQALIAVLNNKQTTGSFFSETLDAYLVHANHIDEEQEDVDETLLNFALNDARLDARVYSVWALGKRNSPRINLLLPILSEPPMLTWGLHAAVLEVWNDTNLQAPNLESLLKIDDFAVQEQLALMKTFEMT